MPATSHGPNRPTHYGFSCGYIQTVGEHVTISLEPNGYHVKRHPSHPCGHKWEIVPTGREARSLARKLAKEAKP